MPVTDDEIPPTVDVIVFHHARRGDGASRGDGEVRFTQGIHVPTEHRRGFAVHAVSVVRHCSGRPSQVSIRIRLTRGVFPRRDGVLPSKGGTLYTQQITQIA